MKPASCLLLLAGLLTLVFETDAAAQTTASVSQRVTIIIKRPASLTATPAMQTETGASTSQLHLTAGNDRHKVTAHLAAGPNAPNLGALDAEIAGRTLTLTAIPLEMTRQQVWKGFEEHTVRYAPTQEMDVVLTTTAS
ncbi:MAG: hypothetical protein AAGI08_05800 [Bacteroidota bacterium]